MRNKIRELREGLGLSQEALAEKVGVTRQSVISIEVGRYIPSLTLALKLARTFSLPVEEVFSLDEAK